MPGSASAAGRAAASLLTLLLLPASWLLVLTVLPASAGPTRDTAAAVQSCAAAGAASPSVSGLALVQARAGFRNLVFAQEESDVSAVHLTLEVDTADDSEAGTAQGAMAAFLVNGVWTTDVELCKSAKAGEAVKKDFTLKAWPSKLRVSARGTDSWGYTRIIVHHQKFVITVLAASVGNSTYGPDSVHWVSSEEGAPDTNTFLVSDLSAVSPPEKPATHKAKKEPTNGTEASSNATNETGSNASDDHPEGNGNCTTRFDPRATAIGYTTSPPGTRCIFGLDPRDEGAHCILDDGSYGSFGWCYTSPDASSFGSCGISCPLFGPLKILGAKMDRIAEDLETTTTTTTTAAPVNVTNETVEVVKHRSQAKHKGKKKHAHKAKTGDETEAGKKPHVDKPSTIGGNSSDGGNATTGDNSTGADDGGSSSHSNLVVHSKSSSGKDVVVNAGAATSDEVAGAAAAAAFANGP